VNGTDLAGKDRRRMKPVLPQIPSEWRNYGFVTKLIPTREAVPGFVGFINNIK